MDGVGSGAQLSNARVADDELAAAHARLVRVFRSRGLRDEDAADLTQETIVRTLTHLRRHGRRRSDIAPLVNTVAKHLLFEHYRTSGRELAIPVDNDVVETIDDIAHEVIDRERDMQLRRAIAELPARKRVAMRMALDGSAPAEIARELGMKRNAVDVLLHRTRRLLAERLHTLRDGVWGAGAVLWTHTRSALRRAACWNSSDPTPSTIAPALLTLAAILIAGQATAHRPGDAIVRPIVAATASVHAGDPSRADARKVAGSRLPTAAPASGETSRRPKTDVELEVRNLRIGVFTEIYNPFTAEREEYGAGTEYVRDDRPGITGPIIDGAITSTCATAPSICTEVDE